jgi:hypothetical protein
VDSSEPLRVIVSEMLQSRSLDTTDTPLYTDRVNGMYGGMPSMIQPESAAKIEAWHMDHPQYHCRSDVVLVANAGLVPILGDVLSLQGDTKPDWLQRKERLEKARPLRYEWSMIWLGRKREPNHNSSVGLARG